MASNSNTTDFDSVQALNVLAVKAKDDDRSFMEIIREFPTIYDKRTNGFRDKRKKANCWQRIAELLETTTEEVERRYKTIRTAFSRYLSKQKLKSGSGVSDIPNIDQRFENLGWLTIHMTSRQGTSNLNVSLSPPNITKDSVSNIVTLGAEDPDLVEELSDRENDQYEETNITLDISVDDNFQGEATEQICDVAEEIRDTENGTHQKQPIKRQKRDGSGTSWVGAKINNKMQLKKTDEQIKEAMSKLDKSLKCLEQSQKDKPNVENNEDYFYCLSLAPRLRRLDGKKKALIRNLIEKAFMEVEYGGFSNPNYLNSFPTFVGSVPNRQANYGNN